MTNNRLYRWIIGGFIILIGILIRHLFFEKDNTMPRALDGNTVISGDNTNPLSHSVARKEDANSKLLEGFKTPIELHGIVVDQHGDPVPEATVELSPVDRPWENSNSKTTISSDYEGRFSIKGLHGISLGVEVSKKGYLKYSADMGPSSETIVGYSHGAETGKRFSNSATPLTMKLFKIGPDEPMFYMPQTRWKLSCDGASRRIALNSKDGTGPHEIEFRFKSDWSKLPMDNEINSKMFDWSFEARIPGGGFIWNESDFNFEAPESGYKELISYNYPASLPREKWKRYVSGRYFVKFPDGSHGRIRFSIDGASDRRPLQMTSWFCLKPGSRNISSRFMDGSSFNGEDPEKE